MTDVRADKKITMVDFCQIKGDTCYDASPPPDITTNSIFAAYTFDNKTKDHMEHLQAQLQDQLDIKLILPHTFYSGTVIFCKLCPYIRNCGIILSRVSDLNRNVIFEHGFALGLYKRGILLARKDSLGRFELKLLSSLERCEYSTRDEIITQLSKAKPPLVGPDAHAPTLGKRPPEMDISPDNVQVYFIKSSRPNDVESTLQKIIKRSGIPNMIDDPIEYRGHDLYTHLSDIANSEYILGNFVSSENKYHAIINARTAFLLGMALGMGKQVLAIQETPIEKEMIDLADVIKTYETETEAKNYVQNWINEAVAIYRQKESKIRYGKRRLKKTKRFRELNFGQPEAEYDADLIECFTETPFYERARRFEKWLFLGRRGAGKTAVFMKLTEELKEKPTLHLVLLEPNELQFVTLKEFLRDEFTNIHADFVFRSIWRYIILTEILRSIYKNPPVFLTETELNPILQFVNENINDINMDFVDRLKYKIIELEKQFQHVEKESEKVEILQKVLSILRLKGITNHLKEFCKRCPIVILMDKVDSNWNIKRRESILLLGRLIQEVHKINFEFGGGIRILLFLREDIYDVLRKHDENLDKKDKCIINWSKQSLIEFIGRRIDSGLELQTLYKDENEWEKIWENVFPKTIHNKPTAEYIIERSLMRPRDVLIFCKKALECAQDRNHNHVEENDIIDSESDYSLDRLDNIGTEYIVNYPGLADFMFDCFNNSTCTLREDIFMSKITNYISKTNSNSSWDEIHEWLESAYTDNIISKILFEIGFIGFKQKDGSVSYSYEQSYSHAESASMIEEVIFTEKKKIALFFTKEIKRTQFFKYYVIHLAFRKVLQCT